MLAIVVACVGPLAFATIPPLVDVPGHMARYFIQLHGAQSATLARDYEFRWLLSGNLGADLIVALIGPWMGVVAATRLVTFFVVGLGAAGLVTLSRSVHGRFEPSLLFALPLLYSFPFNFGFLNYALAVSTSFCIAAGWWRVQSTKKTFVIPMGLALAALLTWLMHVAGWMILCLIVGGMMIGRQSLAAFVRSPRRILKTFFEAAPLLSPLLLQLLWRGNSGGDTADFFNLVSKAWAVVTVFQDRWLALDSLSVAALAVLIFSACREPGFSFARPLLVAGLLCTAVFLILPSVVFGSAYADHRILAPALTLIVLSISARHASAQVSRMLLALGGAFLATRLIGTAASYQIADRELDERLFALRYIPTGARVLTFAGQFCEAPWTLSRHRHLGSFVTLYREGFSNDQWEMPGAQMLRVKRPDLGRYAYEQSTYIFSDECKRRGLAKTPSFAGVTLGDAIAKAPLSDFDFVWVIKPPDPITIMPPQARLVWSGRDSVLFRLEPHLRRPEPARR